MKEGDGRKCRHGGDLYALPFYLADGRTVICGRCLEQLFDLNESDARARGYAQERARRKTK